MLPLVLWPSQGRHVQFVLERLRFSEPLAAIGYNQITAIGSEGRGSTANSRLMAAASIGISVNDCQR
jgi:hypothetical protein